MSDKDTSKRREIIERLLDHLPDYEPAPSAGQRGDGGSGALAMPEVYWERSVQELYRSLECLQLEPALNLDSGRETTGRSVHAHLTAFYHSEFRIVRPARKKRILKGRVEWVEPAPTTWRRERVVSQWIERHLVERGVVYVVKVFRGEPYLPPQVLGAVA